MIDLVVPLIVNPRRVIGAVCKIIGLAVVRPKDLVEAKGVAIDRGLADSIEMNTAIGIWRIMQVRTGRHLGPRIFQRVEVCLQRVQTSLSDGNIGQYAVRLRL